MGRRLTLILACALIVGLAVPAFAEVQNVKVSGDIEVLGISRPSFTLGTVNEADDEASHAASITRLRVDADLTENVGTTVRLINEREWGGNDYDLTADADSNTSTVVNLDLAYITLKEFLYAPLTLTLGRQELHFGNDFIMGDPDTNNAVSGGSLTDADLSKKKAFDAVRATFNYDPLVLDVLWAKIQENTVLGATASGSSEKDDVDLFGVNARYDFGGKYNMIGELYYFGKVDNTVRSSTAKIKSATRINTIGGRIELSPMERLSLQGEAAVQSGRVNNGTAADSTSDQKAWAAQGIIAYALDMKYSPVLTAIYSFYQGNRNGTSSKSWDPMFENQTAGHIINVLFNNSDCHNLNLRGSIVPQEDLTLTLDYVWLGLAKALPIGATTITTYDINHTAVTPLVSPGTRDRNLGNEVDLTLKYDYTEDVQFGLLAGIFMPGKVFTDKPQAVKELIASCKVSF